MKNVRIVLMNILKGKTKEGKEYYKAFLYCEIKNQSFIQEVFLDNESVETYSSAIGEDITNIVELKYNRNNDCVQFVLP